MVGHIVYCVPADSLVVWSSLPACWNILSEKTEKDKQTV